MARTCRRTGKRRGRCLTKYTPGTDACTLLGYVLSSKKLLLHLALGQFGELGSILGNSLSEQ